MMISYTQRHPVSETLAAYIHGEMVRRGKPAWLDVKMAKRDEAAMEEGVKNSRCVVAIISGAWADPQNSDVNPQDNAYFKRPFCLKELRWAVAAGVHIQPVVAAGDKGRITEFFADIPPDLQHLKSANWEHIDYKDKRYFELGITMVCEAAGLELGVTKIHGGSRDDHLSAVIAQIQQQVSRLEVRVNKLAPRKRRRRPAHAAANDTQDYGDIDALLNDKDVVSELPSDAEASAMLEDAEDSSPHKRPRGARRDIAYDWPAATTLKAGDFEPGDVGVLRPDATGSGSPLAVHKLGSEDDAEGCIFGVVSADYYHLAECWHVNKQPDGVETVALCMLGIVPVKVEGPVSVKGQICVFNHSGRWTVRQRQPDEHGLGVELGVALEACGDDGGQPRCLVTMPTSAASRSTLASSGMVVVAEDVEAVHARSADLEQRFEQLSARVEAQGEQINEQGEVQQKHGHAILAMAEDDLREAQQSVRNREARLSDLKRNLGVEPEPEPEPEPEQEPDESQGAAAQYASPAPAPLPAFPADQDPGTTRAETAEAKENLEAHGDCYHIAMQAPQMLVGGGAGRRHLHERMDAIEDHVRKAAEKDHLKRHPIRLSDIFSATCEVQARLRKGLVHCLVWCARGYGWEARDGDGVTSLEEAAGIIDALPADRARPRVAVVCMKFGARHAAQRLLDAGVQTVVWLTADLLQEDSEPMLTEVVFEAVNMLNNENEPAAIVDFVTGKIKQLVENQHMSPRICTEPTGDSCGCLTHLEHMGRHVTWPDGEVKDEHDWLCTSKRTGTVATNLDPTLGSSKALEGLPILACDVYRLKQLRMLFKEKKDARVMIRPAEDFSNAAARCRSVALEACLHFAAEEVYDQTLRVTSADKLRDASEAAGQAALIWLDLEAGARADQVDDIVTALEAFDEEHEDRLIKHPHHMIITCGDTDGGRADESFKDLCDETLELEREQGVLCVHASALHDEFKLIASFDAVDDGKNLLDVFGSERLVKVIQDQLRSVQASTAGRPKALETPVVAIYRGDEPNAIMFRVCVSHAGFLPALRDSFLSGSFGQRIAAALQRTPREPGMDSAGALTSVEVDVSHFAERYGDLILALDKFTSHQQEKLEECLATDSSLHVKGPAGSGKTFVALHFMLLKLREERGSRVLFVAKNMPLALFVTRWLRKRVKRTGMLKRVHFLFKPFDDGPRTCASSLGRLDFHPAKERVAEYDIVVIDEAHHVWREEHLRSAAEGYTGKRRIFLSDESQGLHGGVEFPGGLRDVELTEVMRCSKRVVSASLRFQTMDAKLTCHHNAVGPPLESLIFDIHAEESLYDAYAVQTVKALRQVTDDFPSLDLHGRLAVIVPDAEFREELSPRLEHELSLTYDDRFALVTAAESSRMISAGSAPSERQSIVMDDVDQMDGMEWLVVICVGLDTPTGTSDSGAVFLEARSKLYRGLTRAHMKVLAVNEYVDGGWLDFLTTVRLSEEKKFDEALDEERRMPESNKERMAAADSRRQDTEKLVEAFLEDQGLRSDAGDDEYPFVKQQLMMIGRAATSADLGAARASWRREQVFRRVPDEVAQKELTGRAAASVQVLARSRLLQDAELDAAAAVSGAVELWEQAATMLRSIGLEDNLDLPDDNLLAWQSEMVPKLLRGDTTKDAARAVLATAFLEAAAVVMDSLSVQTLQSILCDDFLKPAKPIKGAVANALAYWHAVDSVRQELATEKRVASQQWMQTHELLVQCRGRSGEALREAVNTAADAWEERKGREREQQKTEQSIWDASGNETLRVRGVLTKKAQAALAAHQKSTQFNEAEETEGSEEEDGEERLEQVQLTAKEGDAWCKKGAIAKTAEGKLGVVTLLHPTLGNEVRLQFANGETDLYIKADSLTQAKVSDAGYEALRPLAQQVALDERLLAAARAGDAAAIERLAAEGASVDAKDGVGEPAVILAAWQGCLQGHAEAVAALARLGADLDATDSNGATALMHAANSGHTGAVAALLEAGVAVDAVDIFGNTALIRAARDSQTECARLLLEAGADRTLRDSDGKAALEWAEARGHAEVAALLAGQTLTEYYAQLSQEAKYKALEAAEELGKSEVVALIEAHLSAAEKVEWEKRTAQAKEKIEAEKVQAILDKRLLAWAKAGNVAVIDGLVAEGASVDAKDERGNPAVVLAAAEGRAAAVAALARLGADLDVPTSRDQTAIMGAAYHGHAGAVAALLEAGAAVDAVDSSGWTALIYAAANGQAECARLLLEAGADRTRRGYGGKSALEWAEEKGHAEVAALLRQAPADQEPVPGPKPSYVWTPLDDVPAGAALRRQEAEPDAQPEPEVRPRLS
eukprot:COSAG04_NODE_880_length_9669_cov_3.805747_3_plen_2321_part_00